MNDDRRKMLTEFLGLCWHELLTDSDFPAVCSCGRPWTKADHTNRTFTTWADLGAVYSRMVEREDWAKFLDYSIDRYPIAPLKSVCDECDRWLAWLLGLNHPEQIADRMELAAEFLEGRDDNR